jgi:hypothetical protein
MITVFKAFERVDKNKENGNQLQSTYSFKHYNLRKYAIIAFDKNI